MERPVELCEVFLAPGERAEVLVDTATAGRAELQAVPYSLYGPGGATEEPWPLAVLDVPAGPAAVPLPAGLLPVEHLDPAAAVAERRIVLDAGGNGTLTIDGRTAGT